MPFKDKNKAREYDREKRSKYYHAWKQQGRCANCGAHELEYKTTKCKRCNDIARRGSLAYAHRMRQAAYDAYGGAKCTCCGEAEPSFLTIDHMDNNGNEHRRQIINERGSNNLYVWLFKHNYPPGYQVLCQNCNVGRWRNGGICPHKQS